MHFNKILLFILVIFFSCQDERSNPFLGGNQNFELREFLDGPTRDLFLIEDFSSENFNIDYTNILVDFVYTDNGVAGLSADDTCENIGDGTGNSPEGWIAGVDGEAECNDADISNCSELSLTDCQNSEYTSWCEYDIDLSSCIYSTKDILIAANEGSGIHIFEISDEEDLNLITLYHNSDIEFDESEGGENDIELRSVYYSSSHQTVYMLDKFEYIYSLYLPAVISSETENNCVNPPEGSDGGVYLEYLEVCGDENSTKFTVNENNIYSNSFDSEIFVLMKNNAAIESYVDESYSEIRLLTYSQNPSQNSCENLLGANVDCQSPLVDEQSLDIKLSYQVSDILFYNNQLFVSNPSDYNYSINQYNYNPYNHQLTFSDSIVTDYKVNTVTAYGEYLLAGMKDGGCYITLLNQYGISDDNIDKLHIADNLSVQSINYDEENNMILLSCGSDGVLLYEWDGLSLNTTLIAHIMSSYAYSALLYGNSKVVIGSDNGIEVFNY